MYHSFFTISNAFADKCTDYSIVTANDRLAAEIKRSLEAHLAASPILAWRTVDVFSYRQFFIQAWTQSRLDHLIDTRLLDEQLLRNLAYSAAPELRHNLSEFVAAWRIIDDYDVDITHPLFERRELGPFVEWTQSVKKATEGLLSEAKIPDVLCELGFHPPKPLILVGFDQYTHPQRRYFDWLAQRQEILIYDDHKFCSWQTASTIQADCARADRTEAPSPPALRVRYAADLRDELGQAANWARETKLARPDATIGIVVPKLAQHYDLVLNQCSAIFDPGGGGRSTTFDIAGGKPLEQQPVWQHALTILLGLIGGWSQAMLRQLASSRYLAVDRVTAAALKWPAPRPYCSAADLADNAGSPQFNELAELLAARPVKQSYAHWCQTFIDILALFRWPDSASLGSGQYQAAQRIMRALEAHANSTEPSRRIASADAMYLLNLDLRGQLFSPERPASDIRILGLLETTGLTFSHLWVCGLDENNFPGAVAASPFIPSALCQQFGVPRASQVAELEFAARLLRQWQSSAGELIISYTNHFEDSEQRLSPLVAAHTTDPRGSTDSSLIPGQLLHRAVRQQVKLVTKLDLRGAPVLEQNIRGGTGLIAAQAACPFRAYGQYRLNLRRPDHATHYPDALRRGNLLHLILQRLLTAYPTQAALLRVNAEEVNELCDQVLVGLHPYLPDEYARHEINRLAELILEWLVIEAQRQAFTNVAVESAYELTLGAIKLKIRIDRIDKAADNVEDGEVADESWIVIDYKTGQVRLPGSGDARLTEPQLPLYSLADERIEGVYFGQIRTDGVKLIGIADEASALAGARTAKNHSDWHTQRQSWRAQLTSLAQDFQRGDAVVDPAPNACNFCHLKSLCRVAESGAISADNQFDG